MEPKKKKNYLVPMIIIGIIALIAAVYFIIRNINRNTYTLKLNGDEVIHIKQGEIYNDLGCIAFDKEGNQISDKPEIIDNVNTHVPGEYRVVCVYRNVRLERKVIVEEVKEEILPVS